jgi:hypothetical protein
MPFEEINQIRRELWEGNRLGPRIGAVTGKILDGVETQMNLMVSTPEQARQVVRTPINKLELTSLNPVISFPGRFIWPWSMKPESKIFMSKGMCHFR